jgi:hypothetical protein
VKARELAVTRVDLAGHFGQPDLESSCLCVTERRADLRYPGRPERLGEVIGTSLGDAPHCLHDTATLAWFDVGQGSNALDAVALDEPGVGSLDRVVVRIEGSGVGAGGEEG